MKSDNSFYGINRRELISGLALLPVLSAVPFSAAAQTQTIKDGSLGSWNDGPAKQAILDFVRATTDQASSKFVPPEQRIATFDQDGTLWVEQPMYTQVVYCLERVPTVVKQKPELKDKEPFRTVLSGDREAMAKLSLKDLEQILIATLTGISVDEFDTEAKKWIESARHPRWKRLYTELTYQPMIEVLQYMRSNGYKTYIVTGGGQAFVRIYSEQVYGIPPEQVVGTAGGTTYGYDKNGEPFLTVVETVVSGKARTAVDALKALASQSLTLELYKGQPGSFRPWSKQMRQPVLLGADRVVASIAPVEGMLHQTNTLDTLGLDEPEFHCH
jgi:hypothetical protein